MGFIYCIENTINNKKYIGKTVGSIEARFKKHKYLSKSDSSYLYSAMRKYGIDIFKISVIEEVEDQYLNIREIFWISEMNTFVPLGYNLTIGGTGGDTSTSIGFKMSIINRRSYKGDQNPNFGKIGKDSPNFGKVRTEVSKENIRKGTKNRWDNNIERKEKLRIRFTENNPGKGKVPPNAIKIKYDGVIYHSLSEAKRKTGLNDKFLKIHGEIIK